MVPPTKGKILIAEDEEAFARALAELLQRHGYACSLGRDAEEAKRALQEDGFDLLVCDLRMPGNDELGLIQWLQSEVPGLPVVLLTGFPSLETAIRSVESEAIR